MVDITSGNDTIYGEQSKKYKNNHA